ncbi:MAG: hypothetical protein Q8R13_01440 [bacterium]|nr:hypothetical protein [bacterium]
MFTTTCRRAMLDVVCIVHAVARRRKRSATGEDAAARSGAADEGGKRLRTPQHAVVRPTREGAEGDRLRMH